MIIYYFKVLCPRFNKIDAIAKIKDNQNTNFGLSTLHGVQVRSKLFVPAEHYEIHLQHLQDEASPSVRVACLTRIMERGA